MRTLHPFFSIIIPTFNRAQLLVTTIKSILIQKDISLEIIVVDDGSQDNTVQFVNELNDERIHYTRTQNQERGASRNFGVHIATGIYINYFDSDDILNPCLFDLHEFIIKNNSPDVVYGLIENVTENGTLIELITPRYQDFKESLLHNNFLACGSVFIKREIALEYAFSEDRRLSGTEDWELWLRLYSQHNFIKFPGVVFKQRQHASRSLSKSSASRVTERETAFIDHIEKNRKTLIRRFSHANLNLLIADRYTLVALAHCESRSKRSASRYWLRALLSSMAILKRKRFWAIVKKLIIH